ncbi:MAG TPA: response regulator transcription factor [Verrucomicrobiae bacterium]|jgi:DNA-binding NarL/FixJ family response regulator|nr:response regulator transcription factor [Verrucomicrobiae bacterium]
MIEIVAQSEKATIHDPGVGIWVVEDNSAYRQSLVRALGRIVQNGELRAFADAYDAIAALATGPAPDVILLDLGLPGMTGIEALPRLKAMAPRARVMALTSLDDHNSIAQAICAGAAGYLLKTTELSKISSAIHEVLAGGAPMTPQVASVVLNMFAERAGARKANPAYGLSPREQETLNGMVEGLTAKEIASKMSVSYHTVDTYVRGIYEKLDVQSRSGAVAKAVRERLF